ncbi:unnamed protein product [Gordionus sp. m RMFG-2023]
MNESYWIPSNSIVNAYNPNVKMIYKIASPIILIAGVIGNSIGIYLFHASFINKKCKYISLLIKYDISIGGGTNRERNRLKRLFNYKLLVKHFKNIRKNFDSQKIAIANSAYITTHSNRIQRLNRKPYYMKEKKNNTDTLLNWFFISNLIYTLSLILFPILEVFHLVNIGINIDIKHLNTFLMAFKNSTIFNNNRSGILYDAYSYPFCNIYFLQFQASKIWYEQKSYVQFYAHFFNPIFKPFLAWSFLIYLFVSFNQMMAIWSPIKYRIWLTNRMIRLILIFTLIYSFMWYAPTYFWMKIVSRIRVGKVFVNHTITDVNSFIISKNDFHLSGQSLLCCSAIPCYNSQSPKSNMTLFLSHLNEDYKNIHLNLYTYFYKFIYYYEYEMNIINGDKHNIWVQYQFWRELMVKILPFIAILIVKFINIKVKENTDAAYLTQLSGAKRIIRYLENFFNHSKTLNNTEQRADVPRANSDVLTHFSISYKSNPTSSLNLPNIFKISDSNVSTDNLKPKCDKTFSNKVFPQGYKRHLSLLNIFAIDPNLQDRIESTKEIRINYQLRRQERKIVEYRQHIKTFMILTWEFVVFILPISMIQMFLDILAKHFNKDILAILIAIFLMMEYCYSSLGFYFLYIANSSYRKFVNRNLY